jgi:peptide/nickel transport system substrate-binding protein
VRIRVFKAFVALTAVAAASALAACSSSSSSSNNTTTAGGAAVRGGTLTMLGTGDVDYIDPSVSYNTVGNEALRLWSRSLYTYPAIPGKTSDVMPDLATAMPQISDNGLTYTVTIRTGAMWDTTSPRQVTAADAVRGLERSCNPAQPNSALGDYLQLVQGLADFCAGFEKTSPTPAAIQNYLAHHSISGVSASPGNPLTITYKLTHPATYFTGLLALTAFAPVPQEYLQYVPASAALAQHTIADGPYRISSYAPARTIVFARNPVWKASTDPIRKAYVDQIDVNEAGNQSSIQQQIEAGTSAADMEWGTTVPPSSQIPSLLASKNPLLITGSTYAENPYVLFNFKSPNNGGALKQLSVRQAIAYAINRSELVQDAGGPAISPPLTHVLPNGVLGSHNFDLYPYNPAKAKQLLAGSKPTLIMLYMSDNPIQVEMFQTLQANFQSVGIKLTALGVQSSDYYSKYLEVPSVASRGVWDLAFTGWYPDWYGDNAVNYLLPQFDSASFTPQSGNLGFFSNPTVDALIQQGQTATSQAAAANAWAAADRAIMTNMGMYPILSPTFVGFHSKLVHNAVYVPYISQLDPANVWLSQ